MLPEEVTLEQRPEGKEGASTWMWGRIIPGRGRGTCKGPQVGCVGTFYRTQNRTLIRAERAKGRGSREKCTWR